MHGPALGRSKLTSSGWGFALDTKPRQGLAWPVGARRHKRAAPLGAKVPHASRQHATVSTDQYVGDAQGRPAAPHTAMRKWARQTHPIERCNNPRRRRVARLVRAAWSVSTKRAHPSGAIKLCMCHYNLTRAVA
jgi:hypothetical protein